MKKLAKIQLDWFQFSCANTTKDNEILNTNTSITIEKQEKKIFQFSEYYILKYKNEVLAHVYAKAYAPFIPNELVNIKVENSALYTYSIDFIVQLITKSLNLNFNNVTRFDVALDVQNLFQDIEVQDFLNGVASMDIVAKGRKTKKDTGVYDLQNRTISKKCHSVKFGNKSELEFELYNKTLEMNTKKFKPYIQQQWKENGLNTDNDVYRLEFRCKPKTMVNEDGEPFKLNNIELITQSTFEQIFESLFLKHFHFSFNDKSNINKRFSRLEVIKLQDFDFHAKISFPQFRNSNISSSYHRGIINNMKKLYFSYEDKPQKILFTIMIYIQKYYLQEYVKKRHKDLYDELLRCNDLKPFFSHIMNLK